MKKRRILLYGSLSLLAIIITAFILVGIYTDRIVDPYVRSLFEVNKPMGHQITFKSIRVNLFTHSIIIKDVSMFPDTLLTKEALRLEIKVKKIRLDGFTIREILFDKTLRIKNLVIDNPEVKMTLPVKADTAIQEVIATKTQKKGSQLLKHILLEQITFSGGSFQLVRNNVVLARSSDIRLLAQSIALAKNSKDEPVGYTYGDIKLSLSDIELHSESGLYDMSLAGFSINKSDSTVALEGFRMIPKYDKKEFSRKLKYQNDRFDVKIGKITISGIGIQRFLAGKPLEITSLMIDSIDADIYRDKNVAFNFNRFPPFYNESFLKIPIPVFIDTVAISHSKILYGELAAGRPVAGTISLDKFCLQSNDLTNQPESDTLGNVMKLYVQALVMGEGPLKVELSLPLEGDLHTFECSGSVGAMQLRPLNDMLEPAINIKFNGGKVNRLTFSFKANDNFSRGWMEFLYKDIDVELLKKESGEAKGFLSTLANWVAVSNNPVPGKEVKIVEIGYERDKNKGLINYVWKTIQSGMVRTIVPLKKYTIKQKNKKKSTG